MTRLAAFLCAVALLEPALAREPRPLAINDATIGIMRAQQTGAIILPEGAPPFPAVVVQHGCNGVSASTRAWARRLASWGYAALIIDSLTSRGFENVCGHGRDVSGRERAKDAFAAAAYLRSRPDIDAAHIGLLGYSHGGWSALIAASDYVAAQNGGKAFGAIIAYYPYCPDGAPPLASDVQILIGDADDWSPVKRCVDLIARYADTNAHRPLVNIYPGALHSFDAKAPDRLYFGHRLAYDDKAATDSFAITRNFLDSHLRP